MDVCLSLTLLYPQKYWGYAKYTMAFIFKEKGPSHIMFVTMGTHKDAHTQSLTHQKLWTRIMYIVSLDSRALLNKSLVLVKYFICGKVLKLFYHHDL